MTLAGGSTSSHHTPPRVAVLTMVHDERVMLRRWVSYYGAQVGPDNLIVLDHNSQDGSTDGLPCTTHRLPPEPWKRPWGEARLRLVNNLTDGLLACYDVVVFTDVDEFLVPDPARFEGLLDYLSTRSDRNVLAPIAVNVLHHVRLEDDLDPERPVLEQRRFVKFAPVMCKPLLKRVAVPWLMAFHGIRAPFEVDPALWMLHLKFHDVATMRDVAAQRHAVHTSMRRGSGASAWALNDDELVARLHSWVDVHPRRAIPELDPASISLDRVVQRLDNGYFRTKGTQLQAMEQQPLRRLPERFQDVF